MKRKLIKKYLQGSLMTPAWSSTTFENLPTRKYYWKQWTPELNVKTDFYTGEPLNENWKVLVDDLGNVVDTADPQVLADYAALSGKDTFTYNHPGFTFTFNKDTNQKSILPTLETADERNERLSNAPIATQDLWELIKLKEDEDRLGQTPEGHKIWLHLKDAEANAKTPGVGMLFGVPLALGVGSTMFLSSPLAFTGSLIGAHVGGKTLDYPFLEQGYKSFGDWWLGPDAPETAKELSNLGTWLGGGMGWSAVKNLDTSLGLNMLKAPTMLADKYAGLWATEEAQRRIALAFLNNYDALMPLQIEDVVATEISSHPLRSVMKLPSVFFAKAGEANRGSIFSLAVNNLKKAFKDTFGDDPVWNLMERVGIPESLRANVEKTLFGPKIPEEGKIYIDPATNVKYPLADPGMTDEELSNAFLDGLRDSYRQFRSPEYKTKLLLRLNWDETKYNEFIQELNRQLSAPFSVEVKGSDELGYYFALVVHNKNGSKTFRINRDRIGAELPPGMSVLLRLREAGLHEGYHASTGGNDGSRGMKTMFFNTRSKYPRLTEIIDHNIGLLDDNIDYNEWVYYFKNTPKPLIVLDLKDAGFSQKEIEYALEIGIPRANKYNKYVDTALEYGARNFTSNFFDGPTENLQLLQNIFTDSSVNSLHGKLLSSVGEINEGSASAIATNLFKSDPEFLNKVKKLFAHMVLSGGESSGLYGVIDLGLPKNVQDYIMHNIIGRRIIAGNKSNWWTGNVQNRAKEVMNEVKVGEFPNWLFKDAGEGFSGQYTPKNNFIAVNVESEKYTQDYIKKHEGDHLIDNTIPLTKEQEGILAKALDEDFLDLPNKSNAGELKGYLHMDTERTTTIHDAVRRLLSEELLKWSIDLQNKLIDKLSDEKIFTALEQSNGYGRRYIEFLRENNGLTHEKANQIRSAMKILCATGDINEGSATGSLDIKNFLDRVYKARKQVEAYLGSEKHVKQIMKSGVSKKEAQVIANEMKNNALKVKNRFSAQAGEVNRGSITGGTTKEGLNNFILNDIIPRLRKSGHTNIPENFTYKIRLYDPEHDVFDALLDQRNLKGQAFNSLVTNDVTIKGPFESQDFGLMAHEVGNHNLRYNLQPDYKPVPRYYLNKYLSHDIDEETLNILLNSHPGTAVILPLEKEILHDAYSFVETFAKLHPENKTKVLEELNAINTLFRAQLSLNGRITGNKLNTIIDNTTDGYILNDLKELMYTLAGIILKIEEITRIPENKIVFMSEQELDSLAKQYPELQKICQKVREAMKKVGVFTPLIPLLPFLNKKDQAN